MSCSEEARKGQGGADKEAAIRFRLSAGHACFDFQHVNCAYASMWFSDIRQGGSRLSGIAFKSPRIVFHKGDSKLASTSSITPSTVMPSSIRPTALGSLPHCRLFSVLEFARTNL